MNTMHTLKALSVMVSATICFAETIAQQDFSINRDYYSYIDHALKADMTEKEILEQCRLRTTQGSEDYERAMALLNGKSCEEFVRQRFLVDMEARAAKLLHVKPDMLAAPMKARLESEGQILKSDEPKKERRFSP